MAQVICKTCGTSWNNDDPQFALFSAFKFSTPNNPKGSYLSVGQIIASGESLLTCPSDPDAELDAAIQAKGQGPRSQARITGKRDPLRRS